ncbi:MAG TPA: OB-fold nucleic acid binding domain-containing protein, partial [Acidobacteriota bacterium]|nr:OB-fold nucleic acid binding domain-containing protein [Acidobacteriota bacterium]
MSEQNQAPQQDENQLIAERREKLKKWRESGKAYPNDFQRENTAGKLDEIFGEKTREELDETRIGVKVAGRIMLKRVMGKACFATIQDLSGRIQIYVTLDGVGAETLEDFKKWDLGDICGAVGTLMKTKTGELTVNCSEIRLLAKSLRPLPEKFHGLTDVEQKYR